MSPPVRRWPSPPPAASQRLIAGRSVEVGTFRCGPDHPNFAREGVIRGYEIVFPRTAVHICHADGRPFVADAATVTLYNAGQAYERRVLDPRGDHSDWFAVDHAMAVEAAGLFEPITAARLDRPWRCGHAPCSPSTYLRQRRLVEQLMRDPHLDDLGLEEAVGAIVTAVLGTVYRAAPAGRRPLTAAQRRAVNQTRALLALRFRDRLGLRDLAAAVGMSPFHLSRSFRHATGVTLHAWRHRLRLHAALEAIAGQATARELSRIALDLGFSSHSHFTAAFRTAFGVSPSALRPRDAARRARAITRAR